MRRPVAIVPIGSESDFIFRGNPFSVKFIGAKISFSIESDNGLKTALYFKDQGRVHHAAIGVLYGFTLIIKKVEKLLELTFYRWFQYNKFPIGF